MRLSKNFVLSEITRSNTAKRKGISKKVVSDLMLGVYTPKRPSDFFVKRTGEINRDLNKREGNNVPNPYIKALPTLNRIINRNRRKDLLGENLNMSDFVFSNVQQPRITTPNLNVPTGTIVSSQPSNVISTTTGYSASLPTAERNKIIEEFFGT